MTERFFPVGATYAPLPKATEVDIAEWPRDIGNIAKLGLTVFRLFLCWDRVEREPGVRDFSRIDRAFDLAEKHGLKVIGNVGGTFTNLQAIYPPRHLVYDRHCTLLKPKPDSPEELRFNRFKLCYDDPVYQELAAEFIREAVSRYRDRPSLLAWSGWNEPRLSECYCRHTVALYREWLEKKYGALEALAEAWSTEFPVRFRSWEDVNPQPEASFEAGGYRPFLDWREFTAWNRTCKFNLVRSWIRSADPDTPVISHMCWPGDADIFGEEDILGTSIYTIHAQGKSDTGFSAYEFTTHQNVHLLPQGRRASRRDPEGFWVVETEAGPVSWVHNLVPRGYSPRKMNARDLLFVAHGARAVLRWLYRSRISDAQAGEFNLVGWDGRITDRAAAFGELSRFLNEHADDFLNHVADRSGVLILDSRDCEAMAEAEGYRGRYNNALPNLYNALLHIGIRAEVCNLRQIREGILDGAKALFIPFRPYVDPWMEKVLRRFVENGGALIAESPFALKGSCGIHYEVTPGGMTDLFGAQVYDLGKLPGSDCGGIPAFDFRAEMEVAAGTVEARFADGAPAVVSHAYGKGRTVLYASQLSMAYQIERPFYPNDVPVLSWEQAGPFRRELAKQLEKSGILPKWRISGAGGEARKYIQIVPRRQPDGRGLWFVLNMDDVPREFSLRFDGAEKMRPLGVSAGDETAEFRDGAFNFKLGEWGWAVLAAANGK